MSKITEPGTKISTRICPVCKKTFILAPEHVYKIRIQKDYKKVCSWHCVREWEKQRAKNNNQ